MPENVREKCQKKYAKNARKRTRKMPENVREKCQKTYVKNAKKYAKYAGFC